MFYSLWNLFQQHTDVWICVIVMGLATLSVFLCILYQRTHFEGARWKEQREIEKTKQKTPLLQGESYHILLLYPTETDGVVQIIQARESAGKDSIIIRHYDKCACFFATLETYTQQEKSEASSSPNSVLLIHHEDPLPVSNTTT